MLTLVAIVDENRPAEGVRLSYTDGSSEGCKDGKKRSFSLDLLCSLVLPEETFEMEDASVYEESACSYRMKIKSLAGCSSRCVTSPTTICSGNGVCGWNNHALEAQCYCYDGFEGSTCAHKTKPPKKLTSEGALLALVCVCLALVLGLVVYMFVKLRKLQVDPTAYSQLEGRCEYLF